MWASKTFHLGSPLYTNNHQHSPGGGLSRGLEECIYEPAPDPSSNRAAAAGRSPAADLCFLSKPGRGEPFSKPLFTNHAHQQKPHLLTALSRERPPPAQGATRLI